MSDEEGQLDEEIDEIIKRAALADSPIPPSVQQEQPPKRLRYEDILNEDASRSTKAMEGQMLRIIGIIESDMDRTRQARDVLNQRMRDLQRAMDASRASLDVLRG